MSYSEPDSLAAEIKQPPRATGLLVRQLTSSDLGLFYAKRPTIQSKQRAININAAIVGQMLSPTLLARGKLQIKCKRWDEPGARAEKRPLIKSGKNWRLGGNAIRDSDFALVQPGDYFVAILSTEPDGGLCLDWRVISRKITSNLHSELGAILSGDLKDGMAFVLSSDPLHGSIRQLLAAGASQKGRPIEDTKVQSPRIAAPPRAIGIQLRERKRARTVRERIRSPHVMEEMLQLAAGLSGPVQQEFFDMVSDLAELLRDVLVEHDLILQVPRDHKTAWRAVQGKLIAHVDGGMANLPALGAAPIAIRVGTYMVRPGQRDGERETFSIRPQLVDELFATSGRGIFNGLYPDMGAVRDAARMATEAAGAVEVVEKHPNVDYVLLHGALVNPVSRYSDMDDEEGNVVPFPEFSRAALDRLLPFRNPKPTGDDAQFISVYLEQLIRLKSASGVVCGVVERPGHSVAVSTALLNAMPDHTLAPLIPEPPAKWRAWFQTTVKRLGISDTLLFKCVLEEGEATRPVPVDRNELGRAPPKWKNNGVIARYPKPHISYLLPSEWAGTIRVEVFERSVPQFEDIARFLMHSSMLLPGYAFPVGLDTADKFAKIPNWMGRPVTTGIMVATYKRALDSGNDRQIDALRHLLCGTERDFFFRPKP